MLESKILLAAEGYTRQLFSEKLPEVYYFHNLSHTKMVVNASCEISRGMQLSTDSTEVVLLAAWFHDTGFVRTYHGHEEESRNIATEFLSEKRYNASKTEQVLKCIMATKINQHPQDIIEKIICDADLYHLSTINYFNLLQCLRKEREVVLDVKMSDDNWHLQNLDFLNNHSYATAYARTELEQGKQENIRKARKVLQALA